MSTARPQSLKGPTTLTEPSAASGQSAFQKKKWTRSASIQWPERKAQARTSAGSSKVSRAGGFSESGGKPGPAQSRVSATNPETFVSQRALANSRVIASRGTAEK
jgi:hypothetical protein